MKIFNYALYCFVCYWGYTTFAGVMDQYELYDFANYAKTQRSFFSHAPSLISYKDLAVGDNHSDSINGLCPNVTSSRGHITVSNVDDTLVCCDTEQWLLPYKDENGRRYYLCGKWPNKEIVSQPLSTTKIGITKVF